MDGLKLKAGERFETLQASVATATGNGKERFRIVIETAVDAILTVWHHALVVEGRVKVSNWTLEAVRRVREGDLPLSPVILYNDLVILFKDHMWRKWVCVFCAGVACGACVGAFVATKWIASRGMATGPHCRALHSHPDGGVALVEDAVASGACAGEVLIRVQAFSVCWLDRAVLRGRGGALRSLLGSPAVTVGRAFAGVVLDIGPGVTQLEMGDEVWGCASEWRAGVACELVCVRATRVSRRPRGMAADAAAAVPWPAAQAMAALAEAKLDDANCKGKRVVVAGANSSEGCVCARLLTAWGARVTVAGPASSRNVLTALGVEEFIDTDPTNSHVNTPPSWDIFEHEASHRGPWDAAFVCCASSVPAGCAPRGILRASAPRAALVDMRLGALISDRLYMPFSIVFAAGFFLFRTLRWSLGRGWDVDFLENSWCHSDGLKLITELVDSGQLQPVLDKVYAPQDFENALAHACSDDAIGTTVVRFP